MRILLVLMADSSASCYCTSGRGKGDVIFTDINISDYYKLKKGRGYSASFNLQVMLPCQPCSK